MNVNAGRANQCLGGAENRLGIGVERFEQGHWIGIGVRRRRDQGYGQPVYGEGDDDLSLVKERPLYCASERPGG